MPAWKEGQRVRIVKRKVSEEDRKKNRYYSHMSGLTGIIQNVYSSAEIAVKIDPESLSDVTSAVQREATQRMRDKFVNQTSEEQKKQLSAEELNFGANYVLLVEGSDLETVGAGASRESAPSARTKEPTPKMTRSAGTGSKKPASQRKTGRDTAAKGGKKQAKKGKR